MQILITGGTGMIGQHLCKALLVEGHQLTVLSRKPDSVTALCGMSVQAMKSLDDWHPEQSFEAVINLAGEPIVDEYWSDGRKQVLRDSRIALTDKLVQRIAAAKQKPHVLLSGSAIGYYGNGGDVELDETGPNGNEFAAQLCKDWEASALVAERLGVRVCLLRTGLVLSNGGLLARMRMPFKLGMGARLGNGKQWMSWIHIVDYVLLVQRMLQDGKMSGPFNMTAPNPLTNAEFTQVLAKSLNRPALFVAPSIVLKLAMGERSTLLLEGQRVLPTKLAAANYRFKFPDLVGALDDLLHGMHPVPR